MIRLLLVDDHTIVLDGIKALLTGHDDIAIIGDASDEKSLAEMMIREVPDIILMDISLPGKSGIELCREIKKTYASVSVLFLSMYTTEEYVLNAVQAGASGYLPKNISQQELLTAIRTIYKGGDYFNELISAIIIRSVVRKTRNGEDKNENQEILSKREKEILKLAAEGFPNSEIASRLFISVRTVESHKNHMMQKLNLKTPVELIRFAIKNNLAEI